eukprot:5908652-Pyramimonas_sp.AAC.1
MAEYAWLSCGTPLADTEALLLAHFSHLCRCVLHAVMKTGQMHEDDVAEVVIVCEPDLNNNVMGSIHPKGGLYEKPVNVEDSRKQHRGFREALRDHGVHCLTVHEILMHDTDRNMRARQELEDLAAKRLTYTLDKAHSVDELSEADSFYLGEKYKAQVRQ